jgi:hypothetical protein
MKILQQAPDVFLQTAKVSNSYVILEEGITPFPLLESGIVTLTYSNVANNATVDTSAYPCIYSRVGNVVTMTLPIQVAMDSGESTTSFSLSLPINSNFTGVKQAYGVCTSDNQSELTSFIVQSDDGSLQANTFLFIQISSLSTGAVFTYLTITAQYIVQ